MRDDSFIFPVSMYYALMSIREHPKQGSILTCDFSQGFVVPEMVKRRPVVVISPKVRGRVGLCTVVPLSTTAPDPVMRYHLKLNLTPKLPSPFLSDNLWVKGDMIYTVSFKRLDLIRTGKDECGKRTYYYDTLNKEQLHNVLKAVLESLGIH